jgi:phosphoribosylformimino-5-aminoimidazole carboxamide ribotide isomerase
MTPFIVFPAIDLRHGRVVRLQEGNPARQTNYDPDPVQAARRWLNQGAKYLHIVNLDGAFGEQSEANRNALIAMTQTAQEFSAQVQFGGGLRSLDVIDDALCLGVSRVVLGTVAVEHPELVQAALARWGAVRIAAGLDARDGMVQVRGWQQASGVPVHELAQKMANIGLRWLVYTDITRDGLQTGLNVHATVELARQTGLAVIASGGVSGWEDIENACSAGLPGVIVGKALYENKFEADELFSYHCEKEES